MADDHGEPSSLAKIQIEMAQMRGEVITELKHITHDLKNLAQTITGMVTRAEINDKVAAHRDVHAALDARLVLVEGSIRKAAWAIIGAWISGLGVVFGLIFKLLLEK